MMYRYPSDNKENVYYLRDNVRRLRVQSGSQSDINVLPPSTRRLTVQQPRQRLALGQIQNQATLSVAPRYTAQIKRRCRSSCDTANIISSTQIGETFLDISKIPRLSNCETKQRSASTSNVVNNESYYKHEGSRVVVHHHSPIIQNIFTKSNHFITENSIVRREPKIRKKNSMENKPFVGDIYNTEYLEDIYHILRTSERTILLHPHFLHNHYMNSNMRGAMVNWLVAIQGVLHFSDTDYYMAVRVFDVTLASVDVSQNMYQLTVITCLLIALKTNGVNSINARSLLSISGHAYLNTQLFQMELKILKIINFKISSIEPTIFVNYYLKKLRLHHNDFVLFGALYLLECLSLLPDFSSIEVSLMSAAAINYVLCKLHNRNCNFFAGIVNHLDPNGMNAVMARISEQLWRMTDENYFQEAYNKYSVPNKLCVSMKIVL